LKNLGLISGRKKWKTIKLLLSDTFYGKTFTGINKSIFRKNFCKQRYHIHKK